MFPVKWPEIFCHCDVNACFASLAILEFPFLKGKCVSVGGDPASRSGIILASNREAKKFGIKTGEPLWSARQKCPRLEIVPIHDLGRATIRRMTDTLVELCYAMTPQLEMEGDDGA